MAAPFPSPTKLWHTAPYAAIDTQRPALSMKGKAAVITGAGGAIGKATALAFAASGISDLALIGRRLNLLETAKQDIESKSPSTRVRIYSGDVADMSSMSSIIEEFRNEVGKPIEVLVSNAGFFSTPSTIAKADQEEWWQNFITNVQGQFLIVRAFLPVASSSATIVSVSSALAHSPPLPFAPGVSAYTASKAAAAKIFEYLQFEQPEMKVINVQPGMIASEISLKNPDAPALDDGKLSV